MYCHNCGNTDGFVLLVELAALVGHEDSDLRWSLGLECHDCASTDVAGDPATVLAAACDRRP